VASRFVVQGAEGAPGRQIQTVPVGAGDADGDGDGEAARDAAGVDDVQPAAASSPPATSRAIRRRM
jgi:hypothetical protein